MATMEGDIMMVADRGSNDRVNMDDAGGQERLDITPFVSAKGYTFPALYSFPPFFSKQHNATTWGHQAGQWVALILSYCRFHRVFRLELTDETCDGELFANKTIQRRIKLPVLRELVDMMVQSGSAEYEKSNDRTRAANSAVLVYWRRPEEWATLLHQWVQENGLAKGILTFYEITSGELPGSAEFVSLPDAFLRKALDVLVKAGNAQIMRGSEEDGDGVKFS